MLSQCDGFITQLINLFYSAIYQAQVSLQVPASQNLVKNGAAAVKLSVLIFYFIKYTQRNS